MKTVIAILCALLMFGCATKPAGPTPEDTIKAGIADATIAAAKAPLFKLTCPTEGCVIGSLEVGNPQGGAYLADVMKVAMTPQPSEASQNFRAVVGAVGQIGGWAVIGHYATAAISSVTEGFAKGFASNAQIAGFGFDANGKVASFIPQPGATTTTNITVAGDGAIGTGNSISKVTDRHDANISCMFQATTGAGGTGACR